MIKVIIDGVEYVSIVHEHPKEAPKKPREFWIDKEHQINEYPIAYTFQNRVSDIHVVELPKGSRVISRDELKKAIENWEFYNMSDILKALGFDHD